MKKKNTKKQKNKQNKQKKNKTKEKQKKTKKKKKKKTEELQQKYRRLSLSRPKDSQGTLVRLYFEIFVARHINFADLGKNKSHNHISQMNV